MFVFATTTEKLEFLYKIGDDSPKFLWKLLNWTDGCPSLNHQYKYQNFNIGKFSGSISYFIVLWFTYCLFFCCDFFFNLEWLLNWEFRVKRPTTNCHGQFLWQTNRERKTPRQHILIYWVLQRHPSYQATRSVKRFWRNGINMIIKMLVVLL